MKTGEDEVLFQQVCAVHDAVRRHLNTELVKGVDIINEVPRDAALLGTVLALLHLALQMRALWRVLAEQDGLEPPDDDRKDWLELAGQCWDDADQVEEVEVH